MSCCGSKKKPEQQPIATKQPVIQNQPTTGFSSSRVPKSTIQFSANDFDHKTYNNQASFLHAPKLNQFEQDRTDRMEDYAIENNQANKSRVLQPKDLLTYDLDRPGGVSDTSVVNTFHYETSLNHYFTTRPNNSTVRNSNRASNQYGDAYASHV